MTTADFYEDDEPVEDIVAAFDRAPAYRYQVTSPNALGLTFTTATTTNRTFIYPSTATTSGMSGAS